MTKRETNQNPIEIVVAAAAADDDDDDDDDYLSFLSLLFAAEVINQSFTMIASNNRLQLPAIRTGITL